MPALLDYTRHQAVERDHLPRVASYDDGIPRVLYWGGELVQSMEASAWLTQRGPLPVDPTLEESAAAVQALQQAAQQAQTDSAQLKQRVLATLQSAVGVPFDNLNNAQFRAIVEGLAWKAGALNPDTTVRPPADWLK